MEGEQKIHIILSEGDSLRHTGVVLDIANTRDIPSPSAGQTHQSMEFYAHNYNLFGQGVP